MQAKPQCLARPFPRGRRDVLAIFVLLAAGWAGLAAAAQEFAVFPGAHWDQVPGSAPAGLVVGQARSGA